jgi:hypothetical protein
MKMITDGQASREVLVVRDVHHGRDVVVDRVRRPGWAAGGPGPSAYFPTYVT